MSIRPSSEAVHPGLATEALVTGPPAPVADGPVQFSKPRAGPGLGPEKRRLRALEYRKLAAAAEVVAAGTTLKNVRDKHERAVLTWTALAVMNEIPTQTTPAAAPCS